MFSRVYDSTTTPTILHLKKEMMQENKAPEKQPDQPNTPASEAETPHKHNPFEDKKDSLTKEEAGALEQFKEAQTERD